MAMRRHCDICDAVIGQSEQYRTIHFGRGTNEDINIGVDPQTICKKCWKTMISSVKPEAYIADIDPLIKKNRTDDIVGAIASALVNESECQCDKLCKTCKYGDSALSEGSCSECIGKDRWEAKDEEDSV